MDGGQRRMSIDNEKLPISPKALGVHDTSLNQVGHSNSPTFAANRDPIQNGSAEAVICNSKKLEDAMQEFGLKIKHHEDNVKYLKAVKNELDDSILDIRVALGTTKSASETGSENKESSNGQNEEETIEQILSFDKSAAAICVQLQKRSGAQITQIPFMKDIIGIVALLGKVDDDNLSRSLSDYLGLETMLGVVFKTRDGVKALETYDREGRINKSSGFHGLGASIGRPLDDRYLVICLEDLRPYTGKFIADDPQRRLDIKKPRYLNEETPPGFLGFAVNMINIDTANLYCVTSTGYGLRETLFYRLFSRLQVYKTRAESGLQQHSAKSYGNIYLTLLQIYLNPMKTTKNFEKKITNLVSSQSPGIPKVGSGTPAKVKGGRFKKIAEIEGAEDTRFSPSGTDSGRSDGDTEDAAEEGDSTIMLDQVLDLLSKRWDRIHGAQALKLLPRDTKLQNLLPFLGPLLRKSSEAYRNFSVIKSLRESENLQVKDELYSQRKAVLKITSDSMCSLCNKKIGTSVFAVYPNGKTIVHFVCFRDSQNMKAVGRGSQSRKR